MKFLIKFVILVIFVIVLVLYIGLSVYGKLLVTNIASKVLNTEVEIGNIKFDFLRFALQPSEIYIPEWKMKFSSGMLYLVPLKLSLNGLEIDNSLKLSENDLSLRITAKNILFKSWNGKFNFRNIDLTDLASLWPDVWPSGFSKGTIEGSINWTCFNEEYCELYGYVFFYHLLYNESNPSESDNFFGIPIEKIVEFASDNNDSINIDFSYNGPLDEFNNPFRYRPGPKIMRALGTYLIKKSLL